MLTRCALFPYATCNLAYRLFQVPCEQDTASRKPDHERRLRCCVALVAGGKASDVENTER